MNDVLKRCLGRSKSIALLWIFTPQAVWAHHTESYWVNDCFAGVVLFFLIAATAVALLKRSRSGSQNETKQGRLNARSRFKPWVLSVSAIGAWLGGAAAWAHHPMGGETPNSFFTGLLSGLGHPVIEWDHFAFLVAMALIIGLVNRQHRYKLALVVVGSSALGTVLHLGGLDDQGWAETLIVLSFLAATSAVMMHWLKGMVPWMLAALGVFHGYAFAEAVVGAEQTVISAYLLGLAIMEFALVVTLSSLFRHAHRQLEQTWLRNRNLGFAMILASWAMLAAG